MAENKKNRILSKVFGKGQSIVETIYDPRSEETLMAIHENGKTRVEEKYTDLRGDDYYPILPTTDFIRSGLVRLASTPSPYEGEFKLYKKIRDFIGEYVQADSEFISVSAIYVMMTWVYDRFRTLPYLRVIGTYGTGKSRFLEVMASMAYKGMLCGGSTTTSAMFRMVDNIQGTLVFDEADFRSSETWSDIVKVLNSGHSRGGTVSRTERIGKDGEFAPRTFSVFTPKILASRNRFTDEALESRCLTRHFYPLSSVQRPVHLPDDFEDKAREIRNQLLSFRMEMFNKIHEDPSTLEGITTPRLKQMALAMTTISKLVGDEVLKQILEYLKQYEQELQAWQEPDLEADIMLCIGIIRLIPEVEKEKKIHMEQISRHFNQHIAETKTIQNGYYSKDEITSKRVGTIVKNLHLRKSRDGKGYFIPLDSQQTKAIDLLIERYGLDKLIKQSNLEQVSEIKIEEKTDEILW